MKDIDDFRIMQQNPTDFYGQPGGAPVSIGFYVRAVWRRKWLVFFLMILITGVGVAYTYLQKPVYESEAFIITRRSSGAFRSSVLEETTADFVNVQMHDIMRAWFLRDIATDPELALARSSMFRHEPDLVRALRKRIHVSRIKNTNIIRITMEGHDKRLIAQTVNKIANRERLAVETNRGAYTKSAVQEHEAKMREMESELRIINDSIRRRANDAAIPGLRFGAGQSDGRVIVSAFERRYNSLLDQRNAVRKRLDEGTADLVAAETQFETLCDLSTRGTTPATGHEKPSPEKAEPPAKATPPPLDVTPAEEGDKVPQEAGPALPEQEAADGKPSPIITAVQFAALHEEIEETGSELEKAEASATGTGENPYTTSIEKKLGKLLDRREDFLREFRRQSHAAQETIAEHTKAEDKAARLLERIESIREAIDSSELSLTKEGMAANSRVRELQGMKAVLEAKYEEERGKLTENVDFLQETLAEAAKIQALERAAGALKVLRRIRKIRRENADNVQRALDELTNPMTDILNAAAKLERLEQAYVRMEEWVRAIKLELSQIYVSVDEGAEPVTPIRPVWSTNIAFSAMLGAMVSFGLAVLLELARKTLKTPTDIRLSLSAFSLGVIPHIRSLNAGRREVLSLNALKDIHASEVFSDIRITIHSLGGRTPAKTILVTSATAREGKSTVAVMLATAFARSGERVLLVDTNLRQPYLHSVFRCEALPGLDDLLQERADCESCLRHTDVPNLSLMPAGERSEDGIAMLQPQRFAEFVRAAREIFDRIIFDSTSTLGVADVRMMASYVDAVIYVVQADRRKRALISRGMESLRSVRANVLGVILNNARFTKGDHYHFLKRAVQRNGAPLRRSDVLQVADAEAGGNGHETEASVRRLEQPGAAEIDAETAAAPEDEAGEKE